jgi:hypothetical protein
MARVAPSERPSSPPRTAIISRPVLVTVSAHGSASDQNCPPASAMRFMKRTGRRSSGKAVDARDRHHVAGGQLFEQLQQLAAVGPAHRLSLPVNLGASCRVFVQSSGPQFEASPSVPVLVSRTVRWTHRTPLLLRSKPHVHSRPPHPCSNRREHEGVVFYNIEQLQRTAQSN